MVVIALVSNSNSDAASPSSVTDAVGANIDALGKAASDAVSSLAPSGVSADAGVLDYFNTQDQAVADASQKYGVPASLISSVIKNESAWNQNAVSITGAQGLMQLEPATATSLGVTDPFDPVQNIDGGTKYLSQLFAKFQSWDLALAAYNWGPARVQKNGYNNWPADTQAYVPRVLQGAGL